ncbi:hypothetical protein SAMN04489716_7024 [Actinoplanes derwentensis]|uniref:Uncharacterized protein n=1 Tax=Actinoplanes derwentensis TaxID=113562 RepID=A0A1H2CX10_9ACTN|nr:hypothetical protein Ade03nite_10050 [Actinoplanes derwentensis]SDT74576.1 hypothetical protein SAMN04489716_7024 [Actinoplanes derwentensis]
MGVGWSGVRRKSVVVIRGGLVGLSGALLALVGLWLDGRYVQVANSGLWVTAIAVLAAAGMLALCGLQAYRDHVAATRDAHWNAEVYRLSDQVQTLAVTIRDLHMQVAHPDGAWRMAMKVELGPVEKHLSAIEEQGRVGCPGCGDEIAKLKASLKALEALVVPETAIYLRGFMDGQGDGNDPNPEFS